VCDLIEDFGVVTAEVARQVGISTSGVSKIFSRRLSSQSTTSTVDPPTRNHLPLLASLHAQENCRHPGVCNGGQSSSAVPYACPFVTSLPVWPHDHPAFQRRRHPIRRAHRSGTEPRSPR
jgi:hypothetical protein